MNSKHKKTLTALKAVGCEVDEGEGSRILFTRAGLDWSTHRPHPGKEARPYHIKEAREFLETLGIAE